MTVLDLDVKWRVSVVLHALLLLSLVLAVILLWAPRAEVLLPGHEPVPLDEGFEAFGVLVKAAVSGGTALVILGIVGGLALWRRTGHRALILVADLALAAPLFLFVLLGDDPLRQPLATGIFVLMLLSGASVAALPPRRQID